MGDYLDNNKFILSRQFKLFFSLTFFLIILFSIQTASADVVSVNAGGSTNLSVSTDRFIEGFFFGIPEVAAEEEEPAEEPPGAGGGAGVTPANIAVSPAEFNINLAVNTTTERTIRVTNLGTSQVVVAVSQSDLGSHVILENTSLTIPAGQSVDLRVVFVALSEPGIFTGTINIGSEQVLVALNVKTRLLLFDSNIVVLNPDFQVPQGQDLETLVTLIPLGDPERLDVTLNFVIKDYQNRVFLTKSETLLVDRQIQLRRDFDTGILPLGDYVIGLELVYPNGVAPSSAHFQVTPPISFLGRLVLFLVFMILVILILIILIILWRRRKKRQENAEVSSF